MTTEADLVPIVAIDRTGDGVERYAAFFWQHPGLIAEGESQAGAVERLRELLPHYLETLRERGLPEQGTGKPPSMTYDEVRLLGRFVAEPSFSGCKGREAMATTA